MGYDAVLPGEADFSLGLAFLREHQRKGVPFTCLNLVDRESGRPLFPPYRRLSAGATRLLVAGVVGEDIFPKDLLAGQGMKVIPPVAALNALAARELPRDGVFVVLSHLGEAGNVALAGELARPALVLGAHSRGAVRIFARGSGSFVVHPRDRGTGVAEILSALAGSGRGRAPIGFADAAAVDGYRQKRLGLLAEMEGMGEDRRKLYDNAVARLDDAIRSAEGKRLLAVRDRALGRQIPDDPKVAAMIASYGKPVGRAPAQR